MSSEWRLQLADWSLHASEFGKLREYHRGRPGVAMEYQPTQPRSGEWDRLRDLWLGLDPHPHVLVALDVGDEGSLLLRYAALDWQRSLARVDTSRAAREHVARWGTQIADAFMKIAAQVPEQEVWRFLRPIVWVDVDDAARLTFLPVTDTTSDVLPPEMRALRKRCDERSLVYAIGCALRARCFGLGGSDARGIAFVLDRCCEPKPGLRISSVKELRTEWEGVGGHNAVRTGVAYKTWSAVEEAVGCLAIKRPTQGFDALGRAREEGADPSAIEIAARQLGLELRITSGTIDTAAPRSTSVSPQPSDTPWEEASRLGRLHEQHRAFADALAVYRRARLDSVNDADIYLAIARCQLALGAAGIAVDYAQRALAVDSKLVYAHAIRARAYEKLFKYEDALKGCRGWLAVAPDDADAHYVRGRALLGLHRYVEARDSFDRASALRPTMLEAMLLRREADRAAALVRDEVGEQPALVLDLPEHLAELREPLAKGRIAQMITTLEERRFDLDAQAHLVRAHCLAFERRTGDAIAAFDRVLQLAPEHERAALLGKAHALLVLHQGEDALALFDRVAAAHYGDLEALEGRALALRLLGRDADAESAQRELFTASASGRA